jgi:hypothetical protein
MRWTIGLLLLAAAGCGYRQTRMVACPETGCGNQYAASASPEGLPAPRTTPPPPLPAASPPPPSGPLPDYSTPTPDVPPPAPTP